MLYTDRGARSQRDLRGRVRSGDDGNIAASRCIDMGHDRQAADLDLSVAKAPVIGIVQAAAIADGSHQRGGTVHLGGAVVAYVQLRPGW